MTSHQDPNNEDLDLFLTAVEAKMRGPYSSLELAKVVTTHALRGSLSPKEYLQNIENVISRTDKVTQLRILVGLLGLDPSNEMDEEVYSILTKTQEGPLHEEWVRVVAGLVRGVMFYEEGGDEGSSRDSCRGEEARRLLDKTCREILARVRRLEKETENASGDDPLVIADGGALFVPERFSLLNPELLTKVIPETQVNPHFQVNQFTDILMMDEKAEKAKKEEFQDHASTGTRGIQGSAPSKSVAAAAAKPEAILPGMRTSAQKNATAKPAAKSKSIFMPTKRPGVGAGRGGPVRGTLHTRKAGAAQSLLGKKKNPLGRPTPGDGALARAGGRAQKFANSKSKMKMIDVTEVQGLNKEHQQRDDKIAQEESREQKLLARKRKILEAAAEKGLVAAPKLRKLDETQKPAKPIFGGMNAAKEPEPNSQPSEAVAGASGDGIGGNSGTAGGSEELSIILNERSNKLSAEDRFRVEQFYTNRFNPTPEQNLYKMKLHEERTTDPATGQPVKETFYLELNYDTFKTKQSKKIKRYD